jgi:hypothetical protein
MTARANIEVAGAQDAIKALRKIDPELRKQFNRDVKEITAPIIDQAKKDYPPESSVPSGVLRNWTQRGNLKFPYTAAAARRGLKAKIDTSRKSRSVIRVQQTNPAAVIMEVAGRRSPNPLGAALDDTIGRASRILWPAAEKQLPKVTKEMEAAVAKVMRTVSKDAR